MCHIGASGATASGLSPTALRPAFLPVRPPAGAGRYLAPSAVEDSLASTPTQGSARLAAGHAGGTAEPLALWHTSPRAAVAAVMALGLGAFCFVTTENLPIGLLPVISSGLHTSVTSVGLLVSAYAVVVVVASPPLTHLTRRLPRRGLMGALLAIFVLANLAAAASPGYWWLFGARVVTAGAQAVFWSVGPVTAVSLFGPEARSRAVAGVLGGSSTGVVLGVPAGTWLGQQGGWRLPFVVLAAMGVVVLAGIAVALPRYHPRDTHAGSGSLPSRRRYLLLLATTVLLVAGFDTSYTYVTSFLTQVAGIAARDVPSALLVAGAATGLGVVASGLGFQRWPRLSTVSPVAGMAGGLFALFALGTRPVPAVLFEAVASLALGAFVIVNQNRVLMVAPGSTDAASAWTSTAFNVGIAGGSFTGGLVMPALGARYTALVGALLALGGALTVGYDDLSHHRPGPPTLHAQGAEGSGRAGPG